MEKLIEELYSLERQKLALDDEISQRRQLIQQEMLKANVGQFKNEFGTISLTERKTITYKRDKSEVAQYLINKGLDNLVEVVPEQTQPNKDFDRVLKATGIVGIEDFVDVSSTLGIITKFNK